MINGGRRWEVESLPLTFDIGQLSNRVVHRRARRLPCDIRQRQTFPNKQFGLRLLSEEISFWWYKGCPWKTSYFTDGQGEAVCLGASNDEEEMQMGNVVIWTASRRTRLVNRFDWSWPVSSNHDRNHVCRFHRPFCTWLLNYQKKKGNKIFLEKKREKLKIKATRYWLDEMCAFIFLLLSNVYRISLWSSSIWFNWFQPKIKVQPDRADSTLHFQSTRAFYQQTTWQHSNLNDHKWYWTISSE